MIVAASVNDLTNTNTGDNQQPPPVTEAAGSHTSDDESETSSEDNGTNGAVAETVKQNTVTPEGKNPVAEFEVEQQKISSMLSEKASKGMIWDAIAKSAFRHTKVFRPDNKRHQQICRKSIESQVCQSDSDSQYKLIVLRAWDDGTYYKMAKDIMRDRRGSCNEAAEKKAYSECPPIRLCKEELEHCK